MSRNPAKTENCGATHRTYDGGIVTCNMPKGHYGNHGESVKLRDRTEWTVWPNERKVAAMREP